ncbi:MAG TPA: small, acid-soluble spore protein, alpha/beta type [Armatimonadota bacterium]|nr:small, acid-soluble spore protein, alpha/beta type [Armatimonadota bacterium]
MMEEREQTMKELEEQVKKELNIQEIGPSMTTEEAGKIGGYMVKHLIERGEKAMREQG